MAAEKQPSDETDLLNEQLSAYFDGELPPEEKSRFEQLLAKDHKLRVQLKNLEVNWGLLESLPRDPAPSRFTASTVEMVAIRGTSAEDNNPSRAVDWIRRIPRWLWIMTAALIAGISGYTATTIVSQIKPVSRLMADKNAQLLENISFLEYFPEYQLVDNIDFLKKLNEIDYFSSRTQVAADPGIIKHGRESQDESRRRIHGMNSGEKNRLHQNYVRFEQLPEEEKFRFLNLHEELLQSENADKLSKIFVAYARWYQQLDPLDQVEITLRAQNEKVSYIQNILSLTETSAKAVVGKDVILMQRWLEGVALRNEKLILQSVDKKKRDVIAGMEKSEKDRQLTILLRKKLKRDPRLLINPGERQQYILMKSRLSKACQATLNRQPGVEDKIQFILDATRKANREQRTKNFGP
ncbi:MAG: hypothetical protein VXZ84_04520 [Planctomycetota bacterium]|nr:hypothetical protein [Planctomycetota bacterium]